MNINDLTKILEVFKTLDGGRESKSSTDHPFKIGENYLIRTVTMIDVGRLEAVYENELVLSSASWIADTDRWNECLRTGNVNECEPFLEDVILGRGAIIDATIWTKPLPKDVK